MIWARRFLIIPLGLVFFVLLVLTLIIFSVRETFLEPQFYKNQLAKADIYNFVLVELSTSAMEELRGKGPGFFSDTLDENPLIAMSLTTDAFVSHLNKALPPSWVQEQVEQVIDGSSSYINGERNSFEVTVTAAERVKATTQEVKALFRKADLYGLLFDEIVFPAIDKALEVEGTLLFNSSLTVEDLVVAVQAVAPEGWLKDQMDENLDEVTAYMVGDQETFEINVHLGERSDIALTEMKTLIMKASLSELIFDEVMYPMLEGNLPQFTELSFGVTITQEETASALQKLVPRAWLEEQALAVINEAGPYLIGKVDSFQVVIPTADRREVALTIIEDLAQSKLNALIDELSECNTEQLPFRGLIVSQKGLPKCVPSGINTEELIDHLDIDVIGGVREKIGTQIPDQLVYTQADLRKALRGAEGENVLEMLDNFREIIGQGWAYTDTDLRADLLRRQGEGSVGLLDDVRAALSEGWTYTDVDLREDLADAYDGATLDNLDTIRSQLRRARNLRFLVYVLWVLPLVGIGVLGGRHWWSKIAWPAATLGIASAIVFAASGPVYNSIGQAQINGLRDEVLQDLQGPIESLLAQKGLDIAQTVAEDFLGGIERSSLMLLVVALVVLGASLVWPKLVKLRSHSETEAT